MGDLPFFHNPSTALDAQPTFHALENGKNIEGWVWMVTETPSSLTR